MRGKVILETARLVLREFTEDDARVFLELNTDPAITRYVDDKGYRTIDEARQGLLVRPLADYRTHGYGRWACVLRTSGEVIGFCGLKWRAERGEVDLGYRFLPAFWGLGFATESGRACLEYGFARLGLRRIVGYVDPANHASVHVLVKLGMTLEGQDDVGHVVADRYALNRPIAVTSDSGV